MTEHPGFGAMPAWLLDHRRLTAQELTERAGLTADEVRAVLAGKIPTEALLRRLDVAELCARLDDPEEIVRSLLRLRDTPVRPVPRDLLERYNRQALAARMADLLDDVAR